MASRIGPEIDIKHIQIDSAGRPLGVGSFGEVWRGMVLQMPCAVKIPLVQQLSEDELSELKNECAIMRNHAHDNICAFYGACTTPGYFRIITELMDGDLQYLVHKSKVELSLFDRLMLCLGAAKGILWLHATRPPIIHRDLKPANLLFRRTVRGDYIVKVSDFGISMIRKHRIVQDKDLVKGSPIYNSPEVLQMHPFNEKTDVYSFAICLWEIISAQYPFSHHTDYVPFATAVVQGERPSLEFPCFTPRLRSLISSMWVEDPRSRPSMTVVVEQLLQAVLEAAINHKEGVDFWEKTFGASTHAVSLPELVIGLAGWSGQKCSEDDVALAIGNMSVVIYDSKAETTETSGSGGRAVYEPGAEAALLVAAFGSVPSAENVSLSRFGYLLGWYGPLSKNQDWIIRLQKLAEQPWFFADIDNAQAEGVLAGAPEGSYLVRFSRNAGSFTLVRKKAGGSIVNTRIDRSADGLLHAQGQSADNLIALVELLVKPLGLTMACQGGKFQKRVSN